MTYQDFLAKWDTRFANNDTFDIGANDLREFKDDVVSVMQGGAPNVPAYVIGTSYRVADLVRYTALGDQERFYYALKAGLLSSPQGNFTDWKEVAKPAVPTALSQHITLVQAQGLDQTSVVAGRDYLIDFGPDATGATQTITVRGVSNDRFDVEGTLEVGGIVTAVTKIDVQAGTWQAKSTQPRLTVELTFLALIEPTQRFFLPTQFLRFERDAAIATLSYRFDNNAPVNVPFPTGSNQYTPPAPIAVPPGTLVTFTITYASNANRAFAQVVALTTFPQLY